MKIERLERLIDTGDFSQSSYFTKEKGWCSLNPQKTQVYKNIENVRPLQVGDQVYFLDAKNELQF